ncbi:TlpA family protein disulfide reductase [Thermoleophilia bacterium SCSIO 60948]|nr:TlpA family protein disulfide reductase [Thermoleophilia bacterium SCSIO 60948]
MKQADPPEAGRGGVRVAGRRRKLVATVSSAVAILGAAAVTLLSTGASSQRESPEALSRAFNYERALNDAPPPLARLYSAGNTLIPGGPGGLEEQLSSLRGHPVVVNEWASWCGPCRLEFPVFQRASARHGERIAFLGVLSGDSEEAAETFLREVPVPYPSVTDPQQDIATELWRSRPALPKTAFYDRTGTLINVRIGPYESVAQLEADIDRYLR